MAGRIVIEAAGGVLWRPAKEGLGIEVALVHRPKYDDWSVPKGKLDPGEGALEGALREVWEETGYRAEPGDPVGETHYLFKGEPKRVRYWSMRALDGTFVPGAEVDHLVWLPPREAALLLAPDRDRDLLLSFRPPQPSEGTVIRALLLTGTVGTGKTTVAQLVGERLERQGNAYAVVDLDWLAWTWTPTLAESELHTLVCENLRAILPAFTSRGVDHLVLARAVLDASDLAAIERAAGGRLVVVRLEAEPSTIGARLRRRDSGTELAQHLEEAARFAGLVAAATPAAAVIRCDDLTPEQVADAVVTVAGWGS